MRARLKVEMAAFRRRHGFTPTLAVVFVGRDAPSAVYLPQILRSCRNAGAVGRLVHLPAGETAAHLRREIELLNADPLVSGIIVQMPLPKRIPLSVVIDAIDPAKDIDGLHPRNFGLLALGYEGFLREHCTVTVCHSRTVALGAHTRAADIVVVAAGRPGLITGTMLKPGAVVVDVGINMVAEGMVGDVDMASASAGGSALSPP